MWPARWTRFRVPHSGVSRGRKPLTARTKKPLITLTKKKESGKIKSPSQRLNSPSLIPTVNKLRKGCAHFWRFRAKNPGCMGEQYFCIRYADTKIRPARLSASIFLPPGGKKDFRCNPGCMGEQQFCEAKLRPALCAPRADFWP
jgi:hypothetical protein